MACCGRSVRFKISESRTRMLATRFPFMRALLLWAVVLCGAGLTHVAAQQNQPYVVSPLPAGGPAPRLPDGHPDLSGHWFPNGAGQGVSGRFGVDPAAMGTFDAKASPEEKP